MLKKIIIIVYISIYLAFCSCLFFTNQGKFEKAEKKTNEQIVLIVNGNQIERTSFISINAVEKYAELPLVHIINSLGGQVSWLSNQEVIIKIYNKEYTLNPSKLSLFQTGVDFNILSLAPGSTHQIYYRILNQEFIIDSDSISFFLSLLDERISIDYDKSIIELYHSEHIYRPLFDT